MPERVKNVGILGGDLVFHQKNRMGIVYMCSRLFCHDMDPLIHGLFSAGEHEFFTQQKIYPQEYLKLTIQTIFDNEIQRYTNERPAFTRAELLVNLNATLHQSNIVQLIDEYLKSLYKVHIYTTPLTAVGPLEEDNLPPAHLANEAGQLRHAAHHALSIAIASWKASPSTLVWTHPPDVDELSQERNKDAVVPMQVGACANCQTSNATCLCGNCRETRYCHRRCQLSHWPQHGLNCKKK